MPHLDVHLRINHLRQDGGLLDAHRLRDVTKRLA